MDDSSDHIETLVQLSDTFTRGPGDPSIRAAREKVAGGLQELKRLRKESGKTSQ